MTTCNRYLLAALLFAGMMCTGALGKTKLIQSWADPSVKSYKFSKVLTVAIIDAAEIRRIAESAMARNIKKFKAIPSCTVLEKGEERDVETAKRKLKQEGFEGAVVLRMVSGDNKIQYVAPTMPDPYLSYWSYNTWAWPINATPGYIKFDQIVELETLFYSIKDDKLLWSGVSKVSNFRNVSELVDDIAKVIAKELDKKGITR
jgi:hypothetical protein